MCVFIYFTMEGKKVIFLKITGPNNNLIEKFRCKIASEVVPHLKGKETAF